MRRRAFAAVLLLGPCVVATAHAQAVRGSGVAKTEERALKPFDRIDVAGAFDVTLVDGPNYKITVEADNDLLDAVSSDVIENELKIMSLRSFVSRTTMKVTVESPPLKALTVSGNAQVVAHALRGTNFAFTGSGSSTAKLGGTVDALQLVAQEVDVEVLGSGTAEVNAVKSLGLMAIGAGTIRYRGNPKVSRHAIGRGKVEQVP
jgi:hypothetical protein